MCCLEVAIAARRALVKSEPSCESALRESGLPSSGDVVDVVAKRHEQVEEELRATVEHLELHGAAPLEGAAAADDEGEIVGAKLGVCVRRVGVRVPS